MIGRIYRLGLYLIAPITIAAAYVHVALGLTYAALTFGWIGRRGRDAAIVAWSRILLLIIGVRLQSVGDLPPDLPSPAGGRGAGGEGAPPPGSVLLLNHTSWLDVFAIAAAVPARFVSKAEIRRWPVFGWLAILVGTIFIERGRRHAVMRTVHEVSDRLRSGLTIAIFPEGTTTDGSMLLPFHANLVQPALDLGAPLRPVGIRFTQRGEFSRAAMYIDDMTMMQSLWRIVTAPYLSVELHWLPPIDPPPTNRHAAARAARAAIAHALDIPLEEHELLASEDSLPSPLPLAGEGQG